MAAKIQDLHREIKALDGSHRRQAEQIHRLDGELETLKAYNDRLRAEVQDWKCSQETADAHLTELREAAEAYMEAPSDEARGLRLRAVLAKVKP